MLIVGANKQETLKIKMELSQEFDMKDLGAAKQILAMRIKRKDGILTLSQEEYVKKVLNRFHMDNAKPVNTPLACHFKLSKEYSPITE